MFAVMSHISHLKKKRTISNQMGLFKFKSILCDMGHNLDYSAKSVNRKESKGK